MSHETPVPQLCDCAPGRFIVPRVPEGRAARRKALLLLPQVWVVSDLQQTTEVR